MENRRPYWQVAVSLLFSILATAAFIVIGIRLIGFLMPFVIGWIVASIATPLVNWLEKRMKIVKKLGSALIVILVLAAIILVSYFAVSRLVTEVTGVIRHTASHVLAQAVKRLFPDAKIAIGPAIEDGFYYDFEAEPFSVELLYFTDQRSAVSDAESSWQ